MNNKDFKIYREGYMLGVKETLDMVFSYLEKNKNPVCLEKLSKQTGGNK